MDLPWRTLASGNGVALAVKRWDPVRVDDVAAGDLKFDFLADRDNHLRCGGYVCFGQGLDALGGEFDITEVVLVLPPPLLTDYNDLWFPLTAFAADGDRDRVLFRAIHLEVKDG